MSETGAALHCPFMTRDTRFKQATQEFGAELGRFVAGWERDAARREELLQEVHFALWKSLDGFDGRCSLRTWTYRVAHNVCVLHVQRSVRTVERGGVELEAAESVADEGADIGHTERRIDLERVLGFVHRLPPLDRQVMLLYLEDLDAAAIGEITGISAANVATRVHRLKAQLASRLARAGKP